MILFFLTPNQLAFYRLIWIVNGHVVMCLSEVIFDICFSGVEILVFFSFTICHSNLRDILESYIRTFNFIFGLQSVCTACIM